MTPSNLSDIRDELSHKQAEKCCNSKYEYSSFEETFSQGFDAAIPYARAQGIEAVIEALNKYAQREEPWTATDWAHRIELYFAADLAVLKGGIMAKKSCPDCGEPVYSNGCVNCNEAGYIIEQYADLNLPCPDSILEKDAEYWKRQKELGREL